MNVKYSIKWTQQHNCNLKVTQLRSYFCRNFIITWPDSSNKIAWNWELSRRLCLIYCSVVFSKERIKGNSFTAWEASGLIYQVWYPKPENFKDPTRSLRSASFVHFFCFSFSSNTKNQISWLFSSLYFLDFSVPELQGEWVRIFSISPQKIGLHQNRVFFVVRYQFQPLSGRRMEEGSTGWAGNNSWGQSTDPEA